MRARQTAAPDRFVLAVEPNLPAEARGSLERLGTLTPLAGHDLLLLRLAAPAPDARRGWSRLIALPGGVLRWAAPVLVDSRGASHYPTGELSVRFHRPVSDEALSAFADAHGLRCTRRNEFVPEQAVFRPTDPLRAYLPDLVEAISRQPEVAAVWANTLSRYRRLQ